MQVVVETGSVERQRQPGRRVRVAIAGCGAVGTALVRELQSRGETLATGHGMRIDLRGVLVRDPSRSRGVSLARGLVDSDLARFLALDADVVIEAIGGIHPARAIVESALRRGRTVVTANKELLAAHGGALVALAARHGAILRYDAAVGGGVPVLRLIDDALGAGVPTRICGILNGTTNHVLGALETGSTLEDALAEARAAGFAEADASRDLDGRDAAAKLAIIAWAAYGVSPDAVTVRRASLLPDPARYTALAERLGRVVRQVAECALVDGRVVASVEPVLVARAGAFAATRREQNRVEVHTGWSAPLCASGPGAGGLPTATAMLSDLLSSRRAPARAAGGRAADSDERRFSWAVEARCAPVALHRLTSAARVVATNATAELCWTTVEDATAGEIAGIVRTLEVQGLSPIAARIGMEHDEAGT